MTVEIRPITTDEQPQFSRRLAAAFSGDVTRAESSSTLAGLAISRSSQRVASGSIPAVFSPVTIRLRSASSIWPSAEAAATMARR